MPRSPWHNFYNESSLFFTGSWRHCWHTTFQWPSQIRDEKKNPCPWSYHQAVAVESGDLGWCVQPVFWDRNAIVKTVSLMQWRVTRQPPRATSSHHWLEIIIRQISTNWASTEISSISSSLLYSSVTFYLAISNIGKCFDWGTVFLSRDHDRWSWNGRWKYKNSVWSISGDCRELKSQFLSSVDVSGPPRNSNK